MIQIQNISHQINGHPILNNITLDIPQNGITALIGANGAGKSTLLSLMARLQPAQSGSIAYNGRDLAATPTAEAAKILSILTQENSIHSRISVRDLLMFGRYPYHQGQPKDEDKAIVEQAVVQFQLEPIAHRYLTELSGGQRQRALIAMVFCQSTEYVLLDEPLNNLDMYYARQLMQLLRELTHRHNRTTVVVLHDINMAAAWADRIVALRDGAVVVQGTPEETMTKECLSRVFGMEVPVHDLEGRRVAMVWG